MGRTNDRQKVQNAATLEKAARKGELDAIRYVMQNPVGRAFAARVLEVTGSDRPSVFQPNAMVLAHDHGVREMGDWLLAEIRAACPEQELVMRHEIAARALRADMAEDLENDDSNNDD